MIDMLLKLKSSVFYCVIHLTPSIKPVFLNLFTYVDQVTFGKNSVAHYNDVNSSVRSKQTCS